MYMVTERAVRFVFVLGHFWAEVWTPGFLFIFNFESAVRVQKYYIS